MGDGPRTRVLAGDRGHEHLERDQLVRIPGRVMDRPAADVDGAAWRRAAAAHPRAQAVEEIHEGRNVVVERPRRRFGEAGTAGGWRVYADVRLRVGHACHRSGWLDGCVPRERAELLELSAGEDDSH